jgi:hypothetical protein
MKKSYYFIIGAIFGATVTPFAVYYILSAFRENIVNSFLN